MGRAVRRPRHVRRPRDASGDMLYDGLSEVVTPSQCPTGTNCFNQNQRTVIFFSNGVNTPLASERRSAQLLADKTGRNITLVHNGTNGLVRDLYRLSQANLGKHVYPAAEVEAEMVETDLLQGKPTVMLCHSAGCAQLNETVNDLRTNLRQTTNPDTKKLYTDEEITGAERKLTSRYDYGPANTRLEKGPVSHITVRPDDIARTLQLWSSHQYDFQHELPSMELPAWQRALHTVPVLGHIVRKVVSGLREHEFNASYANTAGADILQQLKSV